MNDFDELIGADVGREERARLLGVHQLLVEAGPPPELPPALEDVHVPDPAKVRGARKKSGLRRALLIAAALLVLVITFTVGWSIGHGPVVRTATTIALSGTKAAPRATGTLDVMQEVSGNRPMKLSVRGLPPVAAPEYYDVWLVRDGKPWAPCGEFVVSRRTSSLTLTLNAPYALKSGDTWIVTRHTYKQPGAGATVLRPSASTA